MFFFFLSFAIMHSRDHHDVSGTDSPFRETSNIVDGSSVCADMAIQNVIGDAARGATWVSIHNGGGVGWGEVFPCQALVCFTWLNPQPLHFREVTSKNMTNRALDLPCIISVNVFHQKRSERIIIHKNFINIIYFRSTIE